MGIDLGQIMKYAKFVFISPLPQIPKGCPPLGTTFDTISNSQHPKLQTLLTPSSYQNSVTGLPFSWTWLIFVFFSKMVANFLVH